MRRCLLIISLIFVASCSSSSSRLYGSMSEPVEIEIATPFEDTDTVPLLYGFVSDSFENSIFPINLSLRKFVESDIPYFPLRIPVGRYPTRMAVDKSQKRLFVLNYLDRDISVVDTQNLIEQGFCEYQDGKIIYSIDGKPLRKKIDLFVSDIKIVYDTLMNKEYLIVAGLDNDSHGRLKIIDIGGIDSIEGINTNCGKILFDIELDMLPSQMAVSSDGDELYLGSKDKNRFAIISISAQGITYLSTDIKTDLVRYYNSYLYLVDTSSDRFSIFDTVKREMVNVLPSSLFGNIYNQPFQTGRVRDMAFSPQSDLGGIINSSSYSGGCVGTVAFVLNTQGSISVLDVDGCTLCEEADRDVAIVPCHLKGWNNLPVENEITQPTLSRPVLQIQDRILNYNDQGLAEYPHIDGWENSEKNFGIGISRLFRANMFNREIQITYEGAIIEGTGKIINGRFIPDQSGFEYFNITNEDILDIRDINGNPLKNCDDGSLVEKNEFNINSVTSDGIVVDGSLPKDDCLSQYYFMTRPRNGWSVHITGYGFLGRAYEDQTFVLKDDKGFTHLMFTLKSGQMKSERGMKFFSTIFINSYGFSPGERLFTPAVMKVVRDSIDNDKYYGFVVYTGSQSIWQFSSRDLDPSSSIVYK